MFFLSNFKTPPTMLNVRSKNIQTYTNLFENIVYEKMSSKQLIFFHKFGTPINRLVTTREHITLTINDLV